MDQGPEYILLGCGWGWLVGWGFFTFSAEAQADVKACPECFVNHVRAEVCAIVNEPLSPSGAS